MANIKITQLPKATTIGDNDLIPIVTGIGGTPTTEHITKYDFAATIGNSPIEINPVQNSYSDIASMLADQSNQTTNYFNYVIDASADPNVVSGDAYYEKLTLSTTTLSTDYRLLSDTEVTVIQDSNSYRVFRIDAIQDEGTPLTSVSGGKVSFEYNGANVTAILFNKRYTDAISEFYGKDVNVRFYNRSSRKYETEAVASTAWTTVNTDYYRAEVTGTNIQIADLTVNNRVEFFIVEAAAGGGSTTVTAKTGTSIVFTEDAEYYADGSYNPNTSGDITLSLTGAVVGVGSAVMVSGYTPAISGEDYIILSDTSNGTRDIYHFYNTYEGLKLNKIGQGVLTAPVVTLVPDDEQITVNWTASAGATSYTVLRNTTNTTVGATTIYTGALLTFDDTGLTNGTTYYYFVQATGGAGKYNSDYGTNSDAPEAYPSTAFVFNVKTDNPGTSTSVQYKVPTNTAGTYNCTVDWGDGNTDVITTYNDAAWTHTYSIAGTYRVVITGATFRYSAFANGGDKSKILSVEQWGLFNPASSANLADNTFYGCNNLTITATDSPDLANTTSANGFFRGCSSLTTVPNISSWTTSGISTWTYFFGDCTNFNQDLSGMDISGATALNQFLYGCSVFNNNLPTATTTGNTTFQNFLGLATSFNQDISVLTFTNVTNLQSFLDGCTSFNHVSIESINPIAATNYAFALRSTTALDRSLANWDVRACSVSLGVGFMDNTSISQANYDATLIGWDTRTGYNAVSWDFASSQYTAAGAGGTARASLLGKGLSFIDVAN